MSDDKKTFFSAGDCEQIVSLIHCKDFAGAIKYTETKVAPLLDEIAWRTKQGFDDASEIVQLDEENARLVRAIGEHIEVRTRYYDENQKLRDLLARARTYVYKCDDPDLDDERPLLRAIDAALSGEAK